MEYDANGNHVSEMAQVFSSSYLPVNSSISSTSLACHAPTHPGCVCRWTTFRPASRTLMEINLWSEKGEEEEETGRRGKDGEGKEEWCW
eukprot:747563-Hanusia_phi.AAC.1